MKIKITAVYLALIGIGAFGASLAAPQADSRRPGPVPSRVARHKVDRSKSQPPIVTQGSYVVEPPDLLLVEVLEALPGPTDFGRAFGPARREDHAGFLWGRLRSRSHASRSQGEGHSSFAKISE